MKLGLATGHALQFMCWGPLCFHGFEYREQVVIKKGDGGTAKYLCLAWGEMVPN